MDYQEILHQIQVREDMLNQNKIRKVVKSDINLDNIIDGNNNISTKQEKIKGYRQQQEYGEKKFIKP